MSKFFSAVLLTATALAMSVSAQSKMDERSDKTVSYDFVVTDDYSAPSFDLVNMVMDIDHQVLVVPKVTVQHIASIVAIHDGTTPEVVANARAPDYKKPRLNPFNRDRTRV